MLKGCKVSKYFICIKVKKLMNKTILDEANTFVGSNDEFCRFF